jgi:asparagine synthase (glutamine-hydrolysing)
MCGIIGSNGTLLSQFEKASKTFAYRGPDASKFFQDDHCTLGHHRLSILDTASRADQPFSDPEKKVHLLFNGEIFNFKDLRKELESHYTFVTTSDTEVIVAGYLRWGIDIVPRLRGMFALALYDTTKAKLFLARDHAGIKPLIYSYENDQLLFASEVKGVVALRAIHGLPLTLDQESLGVYSVFGYTVSPRTLYSEIHKLPRSSVLEFDLHSKKILSVQKYTPRSATVTTALDYQKLIEDRIVDHTLADVPVGVFFSGGTDSSLIASVLHHRGYNLETFSIKVDYKTEDHKYFNAISEKLTLKSNVYSFAEKEFDEVYETVMSKLDEPSYDNSIFPTYFVSKKAAEKVKVVLSGEGGDELFYGYERSKELAALGNVRHDVHCSMWDYLFFILPPFKAKNHYFKKLFKLMGQPISFYLITMSPARDRITLRGWKQAKKILANIKRPVDYDAEVYLEDDLLRKTDFATSYNSIEGRVPLLDSDIVANSSVIEDCKLEGGVLKAFLKKCLSAYLPTELVYRNKSGFGIGMHVFFESSKQLNSDLDQALAYYAEKRLLPVHIPKRSVLVRKYSNFAFALVSLYRVIVNNQKIYESHR